MGLDQYIETLDKDGEWVEYSYYRKFNELQGWFEDNHNQENCGDTFLTVDIINNLIDDIKNGKMKKTEGFFYGNIEATQDKWKSLLSELYELNSMIDDGVKARYTCWY